jgi:hypothetical protein
VRDLVGTASLTVPAAADHVRFVRLLVTGMADRVGLDYEAIEDLRTAVHEICVHLIEQLDAGQDLHVRMTGRADAVELVLVAERPLDRCGPVRFDPLAEAIVAAACDELELDADGRVLRCRLLKRVGVLP